MISNSTQENLEALETILRTTFNPVQPSDDFVYRVERHLIAHPSVIMENKTAAKAYLVMAGGLFAGVLGLWLLQRMFKRTS